jgi:methionyl-tRNA formyltransferase
MVVAAYGLLLPQWVLDMFAAGSGLGCINVHASLLPAGAARRRYTGAIEAGDAQTGISLMRMDAGLDTGDILLSRTVSVTPQDTTASLHDRLAVLGGELVVEGLACAGAWHPQVQSTEGVLYAAKVDKAQAALDWRADAQLLARRRAVRLIRPRWRTPRCKARPSRSGSPMPTLRPLPPRPDKPLWGPVLSLGAEGIAVSTGMGVLVLTRVAARWRQAPGRSRFSARLSFGCGAVFRICPGGSAAKPVPL